MHTRRNYDDELLTAAEVAAHLRVKRQTVYSWARRGVLPRVTIGPLVRFRARDVERLIETRDARQAA